MLSDDYFSHKLIPLQSGDAVIIYYIRAQLDPCFDAPTRSHDPIQNNRIRFHCITIQKRQEIFPKFTVTFAGLRNRGKRNCVIQISSSLHGKCDYQLRDLRAYVMSAMIEREKNKTRKK
ncbi:hypothetical protein CEXT_703301 [Caerostris extrusa]|uniref:Uncharacterized protein n=1 Tax=Caerostris extrusa TaxID=172846 RepID=A0AAV4WIS2_CAEEX|nr:hypothetical protein CEXT_703301 [Caerostris extrusa]